MLLEGDGLGQESVPRFFLGCMFAYDVFAVRSNY